MRDLIVVIFLLIASVAGMSQATGTEGFRRCFPGWTNASQVKVICNDHILIAQYCGPDENCQTMNKPGVSLEKGSMCLTVTNSSYDSWPCEARSYINRIEQGPETFTVDLLNQAPSTSSSTGNNESQTDTIAAGDSVPFICLLIIFFILYILYMKLKRFRKAIRGFFSRLQCNKENPNQEPDIEKGEEENFLSSG